jgi:ABC-type Na+ efflux pump permease subunit
MLLVPVIMFAVVILGIAASKLFIASVVDHSPTANH